MNRDMTSVNILIGSGGRRNYLVNWFREALHDLGVRGRVCVVDSSPAAPALADADEVAVVPPFSSDEYFPVVAELCHKWEIGLSFSLNDFEASLWAESPSASFEQFGIDLIAPGPDCQRLVEDKAAYLDAFEPVGVRTPRVITGATASGLADLPWDGPAIIKHRYGSGSYGLTRTTAAGFQDELARVAKGAVDRFGRPVSSTEQGLDALLVQETIEGQEFGMDVVHDFNGSHAATLVRRKLRMRSGETDQAVTVQSDEFQELARRIGSVTKHRGLIDTDFFLDSQGTPVLIDVNPRFGGGYPFVHVAGARIPHAYLLWHLGREVPREFFRYTPGVVSSKTEDIRVARNELVPR